MEKKITKKDLAELLVSKYGYTKKEANEVVTTLFDEISKKLEEEYTTDISGFGKFVVKNRVSRQVVNPASKDMMTLPAQKAITFRAAKQAKDLINK